MSVAKQRYTTLVWPSTNRGGRTAGRERTISRGCIVLIRNWFARWKPLYSGSASGCEWESYL